MSSMDLRISIQAGPTDRSSWLQLAREVESAGFHALYAADHPGSTASPFVALAAAASVTERIQLGTCVVNAGVWEPVMLAGEVATLDVVSDGRAILGVGAGHTPSEWTSAGRPFPSGRERVERMIETVEATTALLDRGAASYSGNYVTLVDATLDAPKPVRARIPLLVGGNGSRVLGFAARRAEIAGITGLARTLADGHRHEAAWHRDTTRQQLEAITSDARDAGRNPEVEALVQVIQITDRPRPAAERFLPFIAGVSVDDLLGSPFAWIGSVDEVSEKLRHYAELGVRNYVVRATALADARRILDANRSSGLGNTVCGGHGPGTLA